MTIDWEMLRHLILELQDAVYEHVVTLRKESGGTEGWGAVARLETSDVLYGIDDEIERVILDWFAVRWPQEYPAEVVMEGLESLGPQLFPADTPAADAVVKVLIDPIDGTRMLMHDKRAAWMLTGVAPHRGAENTLEDIELAAMTELPVSKQGLADQVSAVRGAGPSGVRAERRQVGGAGDGLELALQPSQATDLSHGFGSFARLLPQGMEEIAAAEMRFLRRLFDDETLKTLPLFEDQYISTGGQLYELLSGRDRFLCDIRGLVFRRHGYELALSCHPYDLCTALIARELGCAIERPDGGPLDYLMDTTTAVSWVGYANDALAGLLRPAMQEVVRGL